MSTTESNNDDYKPCLVNEETNNRIEEEQEEDVTKISPHHVVENEQEYCNNNGVSSDTDSDDDDDDNSEVDGTVNNEFLRLFLEQRPPNQIPMTLEKIAEKIKNNEIKKVLVLSGAGVSCSAGIPDFRTPGTGLYDNLQKYKLDYPQQIFELEFYRFNPQPFIQLASELWPGVNKAYQPTISHSFVKLLDSKGLLLRNYTQNIDGLEVLAGVSPDKMVACHGHFSSASCTNCKANFDADICRDRIVKEGKAPLCEKCGCYVKPDIVFFGESLPERFFDCVKRDIEEADLLFVMGTSLKVAPVSLIPDFVDQSCPRVLFNNNLVGCFQLLEEYNNGRDVWAQGDCDSNVKSFCEMLGWNEELDHLHKEIHGNNSGST